MGGVNSVVCPGGGFETRPYRGFRLSVGRGRAVREPSLWRGRRWVPAPVFARTTVGRARRQRDSSAPLGMACGRASFGVSNPPLRKGRKGKGGWVGAGVGVSDGGPSLHAARVVAMRTADKPLRMVRRTPVQRLMSIRNISGSGGAVFARTVSAECFTEHFTGLNDSSCGRGHTYTGSSALCCWTSGASSP